MATCSESSAIFFVQKCSGLDHLPKSDYETNNPEPQHKSRLGMEPMIEEIADPASDQRRHNQLKRQTPGHGERLSALRQILPRFPLGGLGRLVTHLPVDFAFLILKTRSAFW
jgi:hypothetical protein